MQVPCRVRPFDWSIDRAYPIKLFSLGHPFLTIIPTKKKKTFQPTKERSLCKTYVIPTKSKLIVHKEKWNFRTLLPPLSSPPHLPLSPSSEFLLPHLPHLFWSIFFFLRRYALTSTHCRPYGRAASISLITAIAHGKDIRAKSKQILRSEKSSHHR